MRLSGGEKEVRTHDVLHEQRLKLLYGTYPLDPEERDQGSHRPYNSMMPENQEVDENGRVFKCSIASNDSKRGREAGKQNFN